MVFHRGWQICVSVCILTALMATSVQVQAQAPYSPPATQQPNASGAPAPLDLPPLPRKTTPPQRFGDWSKKCDARPGNQGENCYLTQIVVHSRNDQKQGVLLVAVGYYGPNKTPGVIMRVPLALGVYLPTGLTLMVPGADPLKVVIESCLPRGCNAVAKLSPTLVAAMKNANRGSVDLQTIRRQQVKLPISFKGITAGLASLNKS